MGTEVGASVGHQVGAEVGASVGHQVGAEVGASVGHQVGAALGPENSPALSEAADVKDVIVATKRAAHAKTANIFILKK